MSRGVLSFTLLLTTVGSLHLAAQESAEPERAFDPLHEAVAPTAEEAELGGGFQFLRAAGSNFAPRDSDTAFSYGGAGCLQRDSNVGDSWFTYDVQLPDGALIDFMRVYFIDNDASFNVNSELWAFDGAGGTTLIAEADSSGTPGTGSASSASFAHTVNNAAQSLVVVGSIQGGVGIAVQLCGIRFRYLGPTLFEDGFETGDTSAWDGVAPLE